MSERAVWRKGPDEGTSWIGYLVADRQRYLHKPLENLGCLCTVAGLFLLVGGHTLAGLGLFAVTFLARLLRRPRRRDVTPLMTLPLPAPAFPCDVEIGNRDGAFGIDRGVVTFIDGWLHFEGHRTTFSLSRDDAKGRAENVLTLRDGEVLRFFPDEANGFGNAIDRWFRIAPSAQGISILPPTSIHPSGRVRAYTDVLFNLLQALALAGAIFFLPNFAPWSFLVTGLLAAWAAGLAVEAYRGTRFLRQVSSGLTSKGGDTPSSLRRRNH